MAPGALARRLRTAFLGGCAVLLASCGANGANVTVSWSVAPTPPVVAADTAVRLRLSDANGSPVRGATLRLDAHMTHPGMQPVEADVEEEGNGNYRSRLQLSMAGDWIFVVAGALPNGRRVVSEHQVPGVRAASTAAPRD